MIFTLCFNDPILDNRFTGILIARMKHHSVDSDACSTIELTARIVIEIDEKFRQRRLFHHGYLSTLPAQLVHIPQLPPAIRRHVTAAAVRVLLPDRHHVVGLAKAEFRQICPDRL